MCVWVRARVRACVRVCVSVSNMENMTHLNASVYDCPLYHYQIIDKGSLLVIFEHDV